MPLLAACDLHLVSRLIGLQLIGVRLALNRLHPRGRCAALISTGRRIRRQEARETPTAGVPIQASSRASPTETARYSKYRSFLRE